MATKDKDTGTPRVFLVRHGQTEWTISGRYTGSSDIPLTPEGERQVSSSSRVVVGPSKLINPTNLARIYISPRTRAQHTYRLLLPASDRTRFDRTQAIETTDDIREWEYGAYEGLLPAEIKSRRAAQGLDAERPWDIWRDGCEGGETPAEIGMRLDALIGRIREIQAPFMHGGKADVVVIAHGHSLRAFAKRWVGFELGMRLPMMLEPGAVGVLSYEHHRVDEPAFLLGVNMGVAGETDEQVVILQDEGQRKMKNQVN